MELGATVVAVSTAHGALHDPDGLDLASLLEARTRHGDAFVSRLGEPRPSGTELTVPCDILVPAALQDVIDREIAARVSARLVVEGANLPTSPEARDLLTARRVTVLPDFIANAGGVIAAAFAMDARYPDFPLRTEIRR